MPPADGAVRPAARFSSVVLPAPFGPASAATCPAGIASVHSRSAQVPPYRLPRAVVSMTFMLKPGMLDRVTVGSWQPASRPAAAAASRAGGRAAPSLEGYAGGLREGSVQVC